MKTSKLFETVTLIIVTFYLSGCAAAVIPLIIAQGAAFGFTTFKTVQTTTGGSVGISFSDDKNSIKNKTELTAITTPAIWPDNEIEVYMAEKMQDSGVFDSVITPSRVSKIIKKLDIDNHVNNMTRQELVENFKKICAKTQADSIIAFKNMGSEINSNIWSFDRGNITQKSTLIVYSNKSKSIVYQTTMVLKSEIGGKTENDQEVLRIAAEAAAEKIILLTQS